MLYEINRLVRKYRIYMNEFEEDSPKQNLLEALYALDAGLEGEPCYIYRNPEFVEALQKFYLDGKQPILQWGTDENEGLIGITKEQILSALESCDGYVDLVLHDDGSIDFLRTDVYYWDDAEEYCDDFGENFESFKSALLDSAEEIRQTGSFNKDALAEKLQSLDIDLYDGTTFFTEQGDNHLCWKTSDGYKSSKLKFIGEYSFNSSFISISDTAAFESPETIEIVTAIE